MCLRFYKVSNEMSNNLRSNFYLKGMAFVTTCPSNLTEKKLASKRLGCENDIYGNNQYICAPNKAKTSLVELCIDGIMGILDEGKLYNSGVFF